MKTILIATDFTPAAVNAANYALELFKGKEARILLYNSCHIPIPIGHEMPVITLDDIEEGAMIKLEIEKKRLAARSSLQICCLTTSGFAVDNLIDMEKEYKPDLIVMGMESAGYITEHILGSVTTSFVQRTATPVLIVPEHAEFKTITKMAFACDYNFEPTSDVLFGLKKFQKEFKAKILVMNFMKKKDLEDTDKAIGGLLVENYLRDIPHSYFFMEDEDFVEGVNRFVKEHKAEIVTIIPHKHGFFGSLLLPSHTKKLAFHTPLPILVLPERIVAR